MTHDISDAKSSVFKWCHLPRRSDELQFSELKQFSSLQFVKRRMQTQARESCKTVLKSEEGKESVVDEKQETDSYIASKMKPTKTFICDN